MLGTFALSNNSRVRYATGAIMYCAQGIPAGLLSIAIPAWLASQDVAVDGMSIDLTPVREQGRLNAFMSFGKAVGWSVTAAISGVLLTTLGMKATAILAATIAGIALLAIVFVLEREGERMLPWTRGKAATVHRADVSFRAVFSGVNKVLWVRSSVIVMSIMFLDGLIYGYGQALMPIAAVKLFGYTTAQWSQYTLSC